MGEGEDRGTDRRGNQEENDVKCRMTEKEDGTDKAEGMAGDARKKLL